MKKKRLPAAIRRNLIIEAALEVFSEKGFEGATVKKIAERAEVNEGLLYRHFKSKQDLYSTIIDMRAPDRPSSEDISILMQDDGDDRKALKHFASVYLNVMRSNDKLVKLISFGQLANPDLANPNLFKVPHGEKEESPVSIVARYIKRRIRDGKFVKKNPNLVARIFVGSIHWYGLRSLIAKSKLWKQYDEDLVLDTIVSLFLEGALADESKRSKGRVKKK